MMNLANRLALNGLVAVAVGACTVNAPPYTSIDGGDDTQPDAGTLDARPDGEPVVPGSWAKQIPGAGFESVGALGVRSNGNVLVGGSFDQSLDIGGGPMTASGSYDVFIAEFTASGGHVWSRRFGGSGTAGASELAILSNGDLLVAGTFSGTLTFGGVTLTAVASADVFAARLDANGSPIWAVSGGGGSIDTLDDLAIDASDNVALCGGFTGSATFFGQSITGSNDPWVAVLTGAGATRWTKAIDSGGINQNCGVALMANGDAVFGGNFNGTVNVGGSTFTSIAGSLDTFVARFAAATGAHVWSVQKGGAGNEAIADVETTGTSVIITGRFSGSLSFGGSTLTSAGGDDVFVAKLDGNNGAHQFSTRMGGTSSESGRHISVRSDGQVAVAGLFRNTADFGGTTLTSNGDADPFVVELDGTSGAVTSVRSVGGLSRDEAHAVASTSESLIFGGSFAGSIVMLGQTYTAMGSALDGYVIRFRR